MHGSGFEDVVLRDAGFDGRDNFRNSYPPLFIYLLYQSSLIIAPMQLLMDPFYTLKNVSFK